MPKPVRDPRALIRFWGVFAVKTLTPVAWEQAEIVDGLVVMLTEGRLPMGAKVLFEDAVVILDEVMEAINTKPGAIKPLRLLVRMREAVEAARDRM